MKYLVYILILIIILLSGCTSFDQQCFSLEDYPSSEKECDKLCLDKGNVPCNHQIQERYGSTVFYKCQCREGDLKQVGCIHANANVYFNAESDTAISTSACNDWCSGYGFSSEPERYIDSGFLYWCNCYKCVDDLEPYDVCYYDFSYDDYSHCYYENRTRVDFEYPEKDREIAEKTLEFLKDHDI